MTRNLGFLSFLAFFLIVSSTASPETIHVPSDYPTIQSAIAAAVDGDTILVLPGSYRENIDFLGKAIVLKSTNGPQVTAIDGGFPANPDKGSAVTFQSGENQETVLEGFTIANGSGTFFPESSHKETNGGGICCINGSTPTIQGNIITRNSVAYNGGGIYVDVDKSLKPVIRKNTVSDNYASVGGGGVYARNASIALLDNHVTGNHSSDTAGACCGGDSEVMGNTFSGNTATSYGDSAGGIACYDFALLEDNEVDNNFSSGTGGGVLCRDSTVVRKNRITRNKCEASLGGSGLYCMGGSPMITENEFIGNGWKYPLNGSGAVGAYNASPLIEHNRFYRNFSNSPGGAIYLFMGKPVVRQNVIDSNVTADNGGGMAGTNLEAGSRIEGNRFLCNVAEYGGALSISGDMVQISGNVIFGNVAKKGGGGLFAYGHTETNRYSLINNTLCGNSAEWGGGVSLSGCRVEFHNNLSFQNRGAINGNTFAFQQTEIRISHSLMERDPSSIFTDPESIIDIGPGMIYESPGFVDFKNGDFHLRYDSPCRDAGDDGLAVDPTDFEGDPRISGGAVDVGADEFFKHLYGPETGAPESGIAMEIIGEPRSRVWLYRGAGILDPPIATPYGDWFLSQPVVFLGLGEVPMTGHLSMPARVPGGFPTPMPIPFQARVEDDLTNLWVVVADF